MMQYSSFGSYNEHSTYSLKCLSVYISNFSEQIFTKKKYFEEEGDEVRFSQQVYLCSKCYSFRRN
jgi:hypothetical protein